MGCALILYHGSIKERGFSRRAERQRMLLAALPDWITQIQTHGAPPATQVGA